jgi:5-methylcytosine-specific restriction endonuclease McrA
MTNKNGSNWCNRVTRIAVYLRDEFKCVYCGKKLQNTHQYRSNIATLDHFVPRIDGGTNHSSNLVTSCKQCNEFKGNDSAQHFLRRKPGAFARAYLQLQKPLPRAHARMIVDGVADRTGKIVGTDAAQANTTTGGVQ